MTIDADAYWAAAAAVKAEQQAQAPDSGEVGGCVAPVVPFVRPPTRKWASRGSRAPWVGVWYRCALPVWSVPSFGWAVGRLEGS